jgi:hypothetical protein
MFSEIGFEIRPAFFLCQERRPTVENGIACAHEN